MVRNFSLSRLPLPRCWSHRPRLRAMDTAMVTNMVTVTDTLIGTDTVTATGMDIVRTGTITIGGMATAAGMGDAGGDTELALVGG